MVSLSSLLGIAAVTAALAMLIARRRRVALKTVAADWRRAMAAALGMMILANIFFLFSQPFNSSPFWAKLGSLSLLASPLACALALRLGGRRSIPRALVVSGVALAAVILWLTVHLKGFRAGWSLVEVVITTAAAAGAVASGSVLGWWSKPLPPSGTQEGGWGPISTGGPLA